MKLLNNLRILISIFSICFSFSTFSANYTTIASGNYNNPAIWSTDGGVTPCGCIPPSPLAGNNVFINHTVTTTGNIVVNIGSQFTVNLTGQLNGTHNLLTWNPGSQIDIFGNISIDRMGADLSAVINLHPGVVAICSGPLTIGAATLNINGAVVNCSGFLVQPPGTMNMINASRVFGVSSNMTNQGLITMGPDCCIESNGNFRNQGGTITGNGAINSGGNINNTGIWDINIKWCAVGTDLGLIAPEDCSSAQGICSAIILPVELVDFQANFNSDNYIDITWATASEYNNDYFLVMRSKDGELWEEVNEVDGVGFSTELNNYSTIDYKVTPGITYYKLIQVDYDGRQNESDVIAIENKINTVDITVYPNPAKIGSDVTIANLSEGQVSINLYSNSGILMKQVRKDNSLDFVQFNTSDLMDGLYILQIEDANGIQTKKLYIGR